MNPKVNFYFEKATKWQEELILLRQIVLDDPTIGYELTEELKWGVPCYTYQQSNILLIHTFKTYCAILFFKGVLLKDPKRILVQQTPNVQFPRQLRFKNALEILELKPVLKAYIHEAVEIEKLGLSQQLKDQKPPALPIPEEFRQELRQSPDLKIAFEALTPGRQRAYLLYFSGAKQSKTISARIEKYRLKILSGKGLDD